MTRNGVPLLALLATAMVSALCFLSSMFDNASVYMWLLNMTGMTGFIAWLGIAVSHTTVFDVDMYSRAITLTSCLIVQRFSLRGLSLPSYSTW